MKLVIERGKVVRFKDLPSKSIALDGYCRGPQVDADAERFSFDHHGDCLRIATKATCEQVLDSVLLGFDPRDFTVYLNDVDGDTVLSAWILMHPERAKEQKVRNLAATVGAIDSHGRSYPAADKELSRAFYFGIMKPVNESYRAKTYESDDLNVLLSSCLVNLDSFFDGTLDIPQEPEENRTYAITRKGTGWVMTESYLNMKIFDLLLAEGCPRAVLQYPAPDNSFAYTVWKQSDFIKGFPVGPEDKPGTILYALNQRESGWGGGSTIGGAPRRADGSRSLLSPDEVFEVVESVVKKQ